MERQRGAKLKSRVQTFQQSCSLARCIQVKSNPEYHTHTHTPHIAAYALPLMPLLYVCVCGCCPSASKAAGLLGQQSVHSLVKPALQALFLRTELLAEQKQMWAPSLLFLHLASASSPPQILSLTQKKPWDFSRNRWTSSLSSSIFVSTSLLSTVKAGETRCVQWLLCPLCRLCEWGVENKKGSQS